MTVFDQYTTAIIGADNLIEITLESGDATTMTLEATLTHEWRGALVATFTEGDGITVVDADTVQITIPADHSPELQATDYRLALWDVTPGSKAPLATATVRVTNEGAPS